MHFRRFLDMRCAVFRRVPGVYGKKQTARKLSGR